MSSANVVCAGCNKSFSLSGHSRHLAHTSNLSCKALALSLYEEMPGIEHDTPNAPDDQGQNPQAFCGDVFGTDYAAEDFGMDVDPLPHATGSSGTHPSHPVRVDEGDLRDLGNQEPQEDHEPEDPGNIFAPFLSQRDWDIAYWAKMRGLTSSAVADLFDIDEVPKDLGLSYRTVPQLNKIIDEQLPGRPAFRREEVVIGGEAFEIYLRDIIPCIRALYGDPEFAKDLIFVPERHYTDADRTIRAYNEMNTGKWWWSVQVSLENEKEGATIIPIIIASDKTQLTLFRNKAAYPVYMTIGNIPKDIRRKPSRRAQVLVGYLPTTHLEQIKNKAGRRRALANLFHACMQKILGPIKELGRTGLAMRSGDGVWRRCHPIFATFVGDYPEQALATCTLFGECPKCLVPHNELEINAQYEPRNLEEAEDALDLADGEPTAFHCACREARIKPVYHPFWEGFPFTDIFVSITPDILHQMYQGVVKHLIGWLKQPEVFGDIKIDARCRRLPPNHNTRLFTKGITKLSRVSGTEHKDMCRILLGLVVDLRLPDNASPVRVIRAVRALLDFLYLAQYESHTTETLRALNNALDQFHENKDVFTELGVREHFNIPKLHSLIHYANSIELFGTTDNYNTEQSERLHIDFAKDAYRATNKKDEYPQMTTWLERREKVARHADFIKWRASGHPEFQHSDTHDSPIHMHLQMTKNPTLKAVSFTTLADDYGAVDFSDALADFVTHHNYPNLPAAAARQRADNTLIPTQTVAVHHNIKFWNHDALQRDDGTDARDAVHVRPERKDKRGRAVPARFDTVLVKTGASQGAGGIAGYRVAQVRVVFQLPDKVVSNLPFAAAPERDHLMYKITRSMRNGRRMAAVIPVSSIERSVQLFPRFGACAPREWTSFNVLELCDSFRVNPFVDRHTYMTIY
ncbi:hypothetical protein BV25DRAFT_1870210 [Artomyces pyxidatus]|uniref:Uncharacterized protein n=1 Tax=Artomyces pyxidatus TaxID=48021 RepID=A0ACB8T1Q8_9AGAM|nr:hypothetical protein BV25DRAFT_1870210 [Artomyces pyxidatus]